MVFALEKWRLGGDWVFRMIRKPRRALKRELKV
jgi:hypothetical protein